MGIFLGRKNGDGDTSMLSLSLIDLILPSGLTQKKEEFPHLASTRLAALLSLPKLRKKFDGGVKEGKKRCRRRGRRRRRRWTP